jgi:hypothetical protein
MPLPGEWSHPFWSSWNRTRRSYWCRHGRFVLRDIVELSKMFHKSQLFSYDRKILCSFRIWVCSFSARVPLNFNPNQGKSFFENLTL